MLANASTGMSRPPSLTGNSPNFDRCISLSNSLLGRAPPRNQSRPTVTDTAGAQKVARRYHLLCGAIVCATAAVLRANAVFGCVGERPGVSRPVKHRRAPHPIGE